MSTSNIWLLLYISLWAITFWYYWKKKKVFGAGNVIIASYLFYAITSFFLYNSEFTTEYTTLTLFPFVYLYLMLLISLQPVLRFDETTKIQMPSESLLNFFVSVFVISSIVVVPYIIYHAQEGIMTIALTSSGGDELYSAFHNTTDHHQAWSFYNPFKIVFNFFSDLGVILFFVYAMLPGYKKSLLIGMGFAVVVTVLETLANGLRTELVMKSLTLLTAYFLFRNHLPSQLNRYIKNVGLAFVAIVSFFLIIINVSRYGNQEYDSSYQLINYTGQANLQFNCYAMDARGTRNGDRTCNTFKRILQFDDVPKDILETRLKYGKMTLNDSRFSTFVGDFVLDFGPVMAAVILSVFSFLFVLMTRPFKHKILFHQLIILYFVMNVCVQGGMYLFHYSYSSNIKIIYLIIFYFIFKWDYDYHIKKHVIK